MANGPGVHIVTPPQPRGHTTSDPAFLMWSPQCKELSIDLDIDGKLYHIKLAGIGRFPFEKEDQYFGIFNFYYCPKKPL